MPLWVLNLRCWVELEFDVVVDAVNVAMEFLSQLVTIPLTNSYPDESKVIATMEMIKP